MNKPFQPANPTASADLLRTLGIANRAAITVPEFSKLCGRARGWAYRRIAANDLRVIQTSGNLLIPVTEVLRYLDAK